MPVFRNSVFFRLKRGLTAFLNLEAGLVRGRERPVGLTRAGNRELEQARSRIAEQNQRIKRLRERLAEEKKARPAQGRTSPSPGSRPVDRLEAFRTLLGTMKPGRLLDLGAGHGKFSLVAQELGWKVTAVDARTERMPDVEGIEWVQSDVREFEIGEYDCICILGLLYHLELEDQLDLLRKCAGTTTIVDTHVSRRADIEKNGYHGWLFREVPGATREQRAATPTAAWGNETAFWPTEESLLRMFHDSGFSAVFKMEPPYTPDRTFYLCIGGEGDVPTRPEPDAGRAGIPMPPEKDIFPGNASNFEKAGREFLGHFKDLCGLQPGDRVLDVGCGIGRMAIPLTGYLSREGSYEGFDVVARGVRWCQENVTPRYPNFRFQLADVHNERYNRGGGYEAREYEFPYEDESFDFVFLASVFTHMPPEEVDHYLSEISRVLKPGGRCLISYFLLNEESLRLIEEGRSGRDFKPSTGIYRVIDPENPEHAVGYDEEYVLGLHEKHGLKPVRPPGYGAWCGRKEFLSYQDIVVATKEGTKASLPGKRLVDSVSRGRIGVRGDGGRDRGMREMASGTLRSLRAAGTSLFGGRPSTLLVSFCNDRDGMRPPLAAVDLRRGRKEIGWITPMEGVRLRGTTGLCRWRRFVCVAHQGTPKRPCGFVILDPGKGFSSRCRGGNCRTIPIPSAPETGSSTSP